MKATVGTLLFSTSAVLVGAAVTLEATLATLAVVQSPIGADTPISGITIGLIVVGGFAGLVALVKGSQYLIKFGIQCGQWIDALNGATALAEVVEKHDVRIETVERYCREIDPILTDLQVRLGVKRRKLPGQK